MSSIDPIGWLMPGTQLWKLRDVYKLCRVARFCVRTYVPRKLLLAGDPPGSYTCTRYIRLRTYIHMIPRSKITIHTAAHSSGGWVVPVARYSACELAWHSWEYPVWRWLSGVVPVAAIYSAGIVAWRIPGICMPALGWTTAVTSCTGVVVVPSATISRWFPRLPPFQVYVYSASLSCSLTRYNGIWFADVLVRAYVPLIHRGCINDFLV